MIIKLSALFLCLLLVITVPVLLERQAHALPEEDDNNNGGEIYAGAEPSSIVDVSKAEYTYGEMVEDLAELANTYPDKMSYKKIGGSLDGRDIYAVTLGDPNAKNEIVVTAGVHGREYLTPLLVMAQLEHYLQNYASGSYGGVKYSEIFDDYSIRIIPMCNPDGIVISQRGLEGLNSLELRSAVISIYEKDKKDKLFEGSMSEYLSKWKANARGVDINRNFDTEDWGHGSNMSRPCFMNYHGESPESEPETKAITDYVKGLKNPVLSLSVHSQGEVIYFNCGQENYTESYLLAEAVSEFCKYELKLEERRDSAFDDWCNKALGIPAVTIETGSLPCPLPISEFEKIWNSNRELWAFAVLYHKNIKE